MISLKKEIQTNEHEKQSVATVPIAVPNEEGRELILVF